MVTPNDTGSIWTPFRITLFRNLWFAVMLSNMGYWMQNIAASWLMKTWTQGDPLMVSLVQTAMFLPAMLFILPAGAVADVVDRRKFLIFAQVWGMTAAGILAVLVLVGHQNPWTLLLLTSMLALSWAMNTPTQSSIWPEVVGRAQLPKAISLYSVANNGARILGPALAGVLIPVIGASMVISVNAASYILIIVVLVFWKRTVGAAASLQGGFWKIARGGIEFARVSSEFRNVLIRGGLFFIVAAIMLAMLPVLITDPNHFGIIFGCFGLGAIVGGLNYAWVAQRLERNTVVGIAIIVNATCIMVLGLTSNVAIMGLLVLVAGTAWFFVMSALQISAQMILPDAVRARGIALLNMVLTAGYALGSPIWGTLAYYTSPKVTMIVAGAVSIVFLFMTYRKELPLDTPAE